MNGYSRRVKRLPAGALALFAATMGIAVPRLPWVAHAVPADLLLAVAATALVLGRVPLRSAGGAAFAGLGYAAWMAVSAAHHSFSGAWRALGAIELTTVMVAAASLDAEARNLVV